LISAQYKIFITSADECVTNVYIIFEINFTLASVSDVGIACITVVAGAPIASSGTLIAMGVVAFADDSGCVGRTILGTRINRYLCVMANRDFPLQVNGDVH
jgi:hypothetical protein